MEVGFLGTAGNFGGRLSKRWAVGIGLAPDRGAGVAGTGLFFLKGKRGTLVKEEAGHRPPGCGRCPNESKPIPYMKTTIPWVFVTVLSLSSWAAFAGPCLSDRVPEPLSMTSSSHPSGDSDRALAVLQANRGPRRDGAGITSSSHPSGDSDLPPGTRLGVISGRPGPWVSSSHPSGDHDGRNPARYFSGYSLSERGGVCPCQAGVLRNRVLRK